MGWRACRAVELVEHAAFALPGAGGESPSDLVYTLWATRELVPLTVIQQRLVGLLTRAAFANPGAAFYGLALLGAALRFSDRFLLEERRALAPRVAVNLAWEGDRRQEPSAFLKAHAVAAAACVLKVVTDVGAKEACRVYLVEGSRRFAALSARATTDMVHETEQRAARGPSWARARRRFVLRCVRCGRFEAAFCVCDSEWPASTARRPSRARDAPWRRPPGSAGS